MNPRSAGPRVVIGIGNAYRRDDGFGPLVVAGLAGRRSADRRLAEVDLQVSDGEPTRLIDLWTDAAVAVVVDVVLDGGDHAGHRYELVMDALHERDGDAPTGSHAISLGSTVALARVLDRLPRRLVVLAVAGTEFGFGEGLTPPVAAAIPAVIERACVLVAEG